MSKLDLLKQLTNNENAVFHMHQEEVIDEILNKENVLCIQKTGWGKSAVYLIATKILREQNNGLTVIISPLLALMRNQLSEANKLDLNAYTINSSNIEEWLNIKKEIENNNVDLLLISPERLANNEFKEEVLPFIIDNCGLLVIDEAHCISDWGHDFRPDYTRIKDFIENISNDISVLATTATANNRVINDIKKQLEINKELKIVKGRINRESLRLEVLELENNAYRLAWLLDNINNFKGTGIIYALTIDNVKQITTYLNNHGINVLEYHSGLTTEERIDAENKLLNNEVKALIATSALAMGYDKKDLNFVIHYGAPSSIIDYWQQAGRAGRNGEIAEAILLRSDFDFDIQQYFVTAGIPTKSNVESILNNINEAKTVNQLLPLVNIGKTKLEMLLKILAAKNIIEKQDNGWIKIIDYEFETQHYQNLYLEKQKELKKMQEFGNDDECLQIVIEKELDSEIIKCNKCCKCTEYKYKNQLSPDSIQKAQEFIKNNINELPIKKMFPKTELRKSSKIPDNLRPQKVYALTKINDGGWNIDKVLNNNLTDNELIEMFDFIDSKLNINNFDYITFVPSRKYSQSLENFSKKLAQHFNIKFTNAFERIKDNPSQLDFNNSSKQFSNLEKSHKLIDSIYGNVLLIDDEINSGWTLSMLSGQLLHNQASSVTAFALRQL